MLLLYKNIKYRVQESNLTHARQMAVKLQLYYTAIPRGKT